MESADPVPGRFRASWDATGPAVVPPVAASHFSPPRRARPARYFASADHKCRRHLLYSPEIEYFALPRSKATAPSSRTTAPAASLRKSWTVRVSASGVMPALSAMGKFLSVTDERYPSFDTESFPARRLWDNWNQAASESYLNARASKSRG